MYSRANHNCRNYGEIIELIDRHEEYRAPPLAEGCPGQYNLEVSSFEEHIGFIWIGSNGCFSPIRDGDQSISAVNGKRLHPQPSL